MSKYVYSFFVFISLSLGGCNFVTKDVQVIDVKVHEDAKVNDQVLQSLMHYAPAYFINNISSLNERNYSAVQVGWTPGNGEGETSFRVFYVLSSDQLNSSEAAKLEKEFEKFIPVMAQDHVSMWEINLVESEQKKEWLSQFFSGEHSLYAYSISDKLPPDYLQAFNETPSKVKSSFGNVDSINYLRYQFYRAFDRFPEQLILNYDVSFDSGRRAFVTVALDDNQKVTAVEVLAPRQ